MQNLSFDLLPQAVGQLIEKFDRIEQLLAQLTSMQTQESGDTLLNVEEAAKFLNLAESTIYSLVQRREIPFCKPTGKNLYFSKADLIEWVKKGRRKTQTELHSEAKKLVRSKK